MSLNTADNNVYRMLILTHKYGVGIALLKDEEIISMQLADKTAEDLASLFQSVLERFSLDVSDIHTLIVGIGPGSFTGIRLGCAFANGIKFGCPKINLLPVGTADSFNQQDISQNCVTIDDLHAALAQIAKDKHSSCDSFVAVLHPEYGREPGPVLKLKMEEEIKNSYEFTRKIT